MTVGEQIGALLAKMGMDATDPKYKDLVTITAAVPEGVDFTSQLFSRKEAETLLNNDATFQFTQKGKYLGGVDNAIKDLLAEYADITPERRDAILNDRNTYNKIPMLKEAIKELIEKSAGTTGEDKKALKEQIKQLNEAIAASNESKANELKALTDKYEGQMTQHQIKQVLASFDYPDNTGLSREDYLLLAENKINQTFGCKKGSYRKGRNRTIFKASRKPRFRLL